MTSPTLPTDVGVWGPGVLKVGRTATLLDVSCYVSSCNLTNAVQTGDQSWRLCGVARPGVTTVTWSLEGNVDVDLANASGLFALAFEGPEVVDWEFTPDSNLAVQFSGQLTITPLNVSAEEYGGDLTSDFSWQIVGKPIVTRGTPVNKGSASPGDVFPTEPTVTASDSTNAAKLGPLGYVADPTSAWTTGQKITVNTFEFSWSGSAWAAGAAALAAQEAAAPEPAGV